MEFRGDPETLEIFRTAGARVDGERVRFDPGWCRDRIRSAPRSFVQHARNPERAIFVGGEAMVFCPSFGPPFVHDLERGRRYATIEDFRDLTRMHHQIRSLHHSGGVVCEPVDLPVPVRHLHMTHAHLALNDKPFMGAVTSAERARDSIEMCRLAMGAEFVDRNCVLYSVVNTNAPLVLDRTMLLALKEYARAGQCTVVSPFVLGGAMSPVTVAATLAQVLAEVMASVSLIQLIRPGAPSVFGTFFSPLSLQTGSPTFGSPEGIQFQMCARTLADRLGLPFLSVGALTASKVPDAQAGFESQSQLMGAVLAGVHFIIHATGCLEGLLTMGYEKTVMDADRCAAMARFIEGVDISPRAQALECLPGSRAGRTLPGKPPYAREFRAGVLAQRAVRQWHVRTMVGRRREVAPCARPGSRSPPPPRIRGRRPWTWRSGKVSTNMSRDEAERSPARVRVDRTGFEHRKVSTS